MSLFQFTYPRMATEPDEREAFYESVDRAERTASEAEEVKVRALTLMEIQRRNSYERVIWEGAR